MMSDETPTGPIEAPGSIPAEPAPFGLGGYRPSGYAIGYACGTALFVIGLLVAAQLYARRCEKCKDTEPDEAAGGLPTVAEVAEVSAAERLAAVPDLEADYANWAAEGAPLTTEDREAVVAPVDPQGLVKAQPGE